MQRAAAGDESAWAELVGRYVNLLWSVARGYRLDTAEAADVVQTTWLRLVERLDQVKDPDRLGGWLATTASREALRTLRRAGRELPTDDTAHDVPDPRPPLETAMLTTERDATLWACFAALSTACQILLRLLFADPPLSYQEISSTLNVPIGAIGPRRGRCLRRLRELAEADGVSGPGPGG
jgi:RNA polymerase sigma factor (sigma-70 family)